MAKKFNGHRCERRNLTDLVLGTGPTGKKRSRPKAKKRPKNYTTEPAINRMNLGGNPPPLTRKILPSVLPFQEPPLTEQSSTTQVAMPGMPERVLNQDMIPDVTYRVPTAQADADQTQKVTIVNALANAKNSGEESLVEDLLEVLPGFNVVLGADDAYRAAMDLYENGIKDNPQLYDNVLDILGVVPVGGAFAGVAKGARKAAKLKAAAQLAGKAPTSLRDVRTAGTISGISLRTPGLAADRTEDERGINNRYGGVPKAQYGLPTAFTGQEMFDELGNVVTDPELATSFMTEEKIPAYLSKLTNEAGLKNLAGTALGTLGSYFSEQAINPKSLEDPTRFYAKDKTNAVLGDVLTGASQGMQFGPFGMLALAGANVMLGNDRRRKEKEMFIENDEDRRLELGEANSALAEARANNAYATFNETGNFMNPFGAMMRMGGTPDYETEKNEIILASPSDKPVAMSGRPYKQLSTNVYKGQGPSHERGGIPTKGATEPFVDSGGTPHDSPYVFSDDASMKMDPTEFLKMIS